MLCYVKDTEKYYNWKNSIWSEFSGGGSGNLLIYRVDSFNDMNSINTKNLEYGSLCHVLNDENLRYMYYYGKEGWQSISHKYKVWIGKEPPNDKNSLWVDTRMMELDLSTGQESSIPQSVKYLIDVISNLSNEIINLTAKVNILNNEIETIKKQIGSGGIITDNNIYLTTEDDKIITTEDGIPILYEESKGNSGGSGDGTGGEDKPPTDNNTYIVTEDDKIITTEDGIPILYEESKGSSGGGTTPSVDNNTYIATEDGKIITTEDGKLILHEQSKGNSGGTTGDTGKTDKNTYIISENGKIIITENGKAIIPENKK